jgi:uncharacterized protein (DUF952 family)
MIYHITTKQGWKDAMERFFFTNLLDTEGFIHNRTQEQVAAVVERYYKARLTSY